MIDSVSLEFWEPDCNYAGMIVKQTKTIPSFTGPWTVQDNILTGIRLSEEDKSSMTVDKRTRSKQQ